MEISVKGHHVLITAAASGIGHAFAKAFLCSEAGGKISGQALSVDGHTETLRA